MVPFFAGDFAGFASNAHSRIGEEPNFDVVSDVRMTALIRAVCAFADHENQISKAGTQEDSAQEGRFIWGKQPCQSLPVFLSSLFTIPILSLQSRGRRRFVLFGKNALPDAGSLARFAVRIC